MLINDIFPKNQYINGYDRNGLTIDGYTKNEVHHINKLSQMDKSDLPRMTSEELDKLLGI